MRPFRFGVVAAQASSGADWRELATRLEAIGYSNLVLPDSPTGPILSPFSAMGVAAAVTTRLRVGNWVLVNDLRNPVLLAREAATLAMLSDGRFDLGLGAGRADNDYAGIGLAAASGATRVKRLDESLQIIRRLVRGEQVTFTGQHYQVAGVSVYPTPTTPVPIVVAAAGSASLAAAGRSADVVALASGSRGQFLEQVGRLRAAAGERFEQIELASIAWVAPEGNDAVRQFSEQMARRLTGRDLGELSASGAPNVVMGSPDGIVEQLQERRAVLGLSYLVFSVQVAQGLAPIVERLAGT